MPSTRMILPSAVSTPLRSTGLVTLAATTSIGSTSGVLFSGSVVEAAGGYRRGGPAYTKVGRKFAGGHESVKHSLGEYVRGDVTTNTVEGVFSLLKRGVMGSFHSVSRKHLPNYLGEFEFRWNTRKVDDGERVARAIKVVEGKRLEYRESVDNPPYLVG